MWNRSFAKNNTLIAEIDGNIVGRADMDSAGRLDRAYVHRDYQRRGIAAALVCALERRVAEAGVTCFEAYALITARPFFEKQGYMVERENRVIRNGVILINCKMVKCG